MSFNVYGVGNAIMDLQVQCDDAFLSANNIEKGIMTLTEASDQQKILKALSEHAINYCSGGSAANTIVGIADMGGTVNYCGKTGSDNFGQKYASDLRDLGIHFGAKASNETTGTCVVLITPDAQRTMLTNLGVSATLSKDDIDEDAIAKSDYVYIEGYLFAGESTKEAALHAIDIASQCNTKVALTISDPFLVDICRDDFKYLIEGPVDLLFCNEDEATALTGKDNPVDAAHEIHKSCENVALTLGKNGSIIMHEGEVIAIEGVCVDAVDTTGAGDMYAAGILYGITNDLTWQQAGRLGSHAASKIVSQLGARLPTPMSQEEIKALLA
jgi:sugar/nucleoside kinase (ribokinase family)